MLVGAWAQLYRRQLREVEWLHEHDAETGLLNSAGLLKQLDPLLSRADPDQRFVVSISQLNNFLEIQNTFGSAFGRQVLAAVVDRARSVIPEHSLVALIQPDRLATVVADVEACSADPRTARVSDRGVLHRRRRTDPRGSQHRHRDVPRARSYR